MPAPIKPRDSKHVQSWRKRSKWNFQFKRAVRLLQDAFSGVLDYKYPEIQKSAAVSKVILVKLGPTHKILKVNFRALMNASCWFQPLQENIIRIIIKLKIVSKCKSQTCWKRGTGRWHLMSFDATMLRGVSRFIVAGSRSQWSASKWFQGTCAHFTTIKMAKGSKGAVSFIVIALCGNHSSIN